jgi:hypothetical protein
MRKKQLRPLELTAPEQFAEFIRALWDELYWANVYYELFKEASRLWKLYEKGVRYSPFFWAYTLRAHCQTALVYLHRIYDQNEKSFSLHRFLFTVRDNPDIFDSTAVRNRRENDAHAEDLIPAIGPLDHSQLERDIEFCSDRNPKVLNLKTWRDRITFHKDERELFRQKRFEEDYPLPFTDIDELIEAGFEILNRYSQYFDTTIRSRGSREWKDMEFVFEALTHYPDFSPRV